MSLLQSVQQTISNHRFFEPSGLILIAASGGPDSTALLHALHSLGYRLEAAHLHHGIRGEEADQDAAFVEVLCRKLAIPCHIGRRDVPRLRRESHVSTQEAARQARYDFLAETAQAIGAGAIATAHTRDDRTETVLLNILRGTGVEGLRGIPYRRGLFVRPLLDTSRADVEAYCEEHELSPRRDSSNLSNAYARNNVRRELIPYISRRYNPSVGDALLRLSEIAAEESDYLASIARDWLAVHAGMRVEDLTALPIALQRRVLREWIREYRGDALANIGHETIEALRRSLGTPFAITLPGGDWIISSDGATLKLARLDRPEETPAVEVPISPAEKVAFFDWIVEVGGLAEGIDLGSLCLRNWREGDRMKLAGGSKKLQDIFTDAKVPRTSRHTWPIVADKHGPLIVVDIAASVRAKGLTATAERRSPEEDR